MLRKTFFFNLGFFPRTFAIYRATGEGQATSSTPPQPAWDVSETSQLDLHWERHLRDLLETSQIRWIFCDVFKTSHIHLKKDDFSVTSLRRLKNISKEMSLCHVFKTSRAYLKKDVFSVTPLKRLKNISRKCLWFFKYSPQKWFRVISAGLLQYLIKQMWGRHKHSRN